MKPRGRRVPMPDEIRNWDVITNMPSEEAWEKAETHHIINPSAIATGAIQHPNTGLWQVWISLYGTDLTQWAAFETESQALHWMRKIGGAYSSNTFQTSEQVADLIQAASDAGGHDTLPLPDDLVREILTQVAVKAKQGRPRK